MSDKHTLTLPRLVIDTRRPGDKHIVVTGGNLYIKVDFDDVDHVAVAREIDIVVDACNAHDELVAALTRIRDGNRRIVKEGATITRVELLAAIDVVADFADAALAKVTP